MVESGRSSPEAAELAELLAELGASELLAVEPPQPVRMLQASAAQSSSERMRVYLNFIVVSSLSGAAAGPQHFKTIHLSIRSAAAVVNRTAQNEFQAGNMHSAQRRNAFLGTCILDIFAKIG